MHKSTACQMKYFFLFIFLNSFDNKENAQTVAF